MQSWHIEQLGSIDGLVRRSHAIPEPGAQQVLIHVRANSLNARDLGIIMGQYNPQLRLGTVPLSDGAGEVVAVGSGVQRFKSGDRVAGIFHQGWLSGPRTPEIPRADLGGGIDGMLSEYVVLPEDGLVRIPAHLSYEEAATLPCAAVTAWNGLTAHGPLLPGATVLVQGSGGVAVFGLQMAKLFGARVVALSSSAARLERLRTLGADILVNYTEHPEWDKEVMRLTDQRGVDVALEVVGNLDKTFRSLRIGGQLSFIGRLGNRDAAVSLAAIVARNIRIVGIGVGSRTDFETMNRALEMHDLHPLIERSFAFEEAQEAYRAFASREHIGKIVIRGA